MNRIVYGFVVAAAVFAAGCATEQTRRISEGEDTEVTSGFAEADLRKKTGLTVLCIRRAGEGSGAGRSVIVPQPSDRLEGDDKLVVFGETKQIDALS